MIHVASVAFALALLVGCAHSSTSASNASNPPPNLAQVDPGIWRSGQPATPEQWAYLKSIGVKHVLKLNFDTEGSDKEALTQGLDVHPLSIQPEGDKDVIHKVLGTIVKPSEETLNEAEKLLESGDGWLVHCTHGQDRTGLVVGRYRVLHDSWTPKAAYQEMLAHRFHPELHGLHESWEGFASSH